MFRKFVRCLIIAMAILAFAAALYYAWPLFAVGLGLIVFSLSLWGAVSWCLATLMWAFGSQPWRKCWDDVMDLWNSI